MGPFRSGWLGAEDCGNTHDGKEGTRNRAGGSPGVQPGPSGVAHESGNAKAKPANESEDHETAEKFSTHRAGQEEDECSSTWFRLVTDPWMCADAPARPVDP